MDNLRNYRDIVQRTLMEYVGSPYAHGDMCIVPMFDKENDRYALMRMGWDGNENAYGIVMHLDIINGKIWIQCDNTDPVVAHDLERAGVPKHDIVLGFQPPDVRPLTEYAVA